MTSVPYQFIDFSVWVLWKWSSKISFLNVFYKNYLHTLAALSAFWTIFSRKRNCCFMQLKSEFSERELWEPRPIWARPHWSLQTRSFEAFCSSLQLLLAPPSTFWFLPCLSVLHHEKSAAASHRVSSWAARPHAISVKNRGSKCFRGLFWNDLNDLF